MTKQELVENIRRKQSFLCVGLDTDLKKIPQHLLSEDDPIFAFNKAIIDATAPYCVAYKPNLAFYECFGVKGWIAFEKTVNYIKQNYQVWIARYGEYKPDVNLVYWQLSPDGRVRGIKTEVDINVFNGFQKEFEEYNQ